jgi:hypothetical protein
METDTSAQVEADFGESADGQGPADATADAALPADDGQNGSGE